MGVSGICKACGLLSPPLLAHPEETCFEVAVSASDVMIDSGAPDGADVRNDVDVFSCLETDVRAGKGEETIPWLLGIACSWLVVNRDASCSLVARCLVLGLRNMVVSMAEESRITISESLSSCESPPLLLLRISWAVFSPMLAESLVLVAASCSRSGFVASNPCSAARSATCCSGGVFAAVFPEEVDEIADSSSSKRLRIGWKACD